jgi:microcystin-dependent protein
MEPYIGELKIYAFDLIPKDWAACNGQLIDINANRPLFSIIGTQYGGNGMTNFALPDLRGRAPMHGKTVGQKFGANATTLIGDNLAPHVHGLNASTEAIDTSTAANSLLGKSVEQLQYASQKGFGVRMAEGSISGPFGAGVPVNNMQPYLGLSICIALKGIMPSKG